MRVANFIGIVLLLISCNTSQNDKAYNLLYGMSDVQLNQRDIRLLEFQDHSSGLTGKDEITQGIFELRDISTDSLEEKLTKLGYKRLPIQGIVLGNGFNGNVKLSDTGYYRLTLSHRSKIDQLVIFDFSRRRIIIYKEVD